MNENQMSDMANEAVRIASEEFGIELDYSVESLKGVDKIFEDFRKRGCTLTEISDKVRAFGCYAGEVLIRQTGGTWCAIAGDARLEKHFDLGIGFVIDLKPTVSNPISKAEKLLKYGPEDSLFGFAHTALAFHARDKK